MAVLGSIDLFDLYSGDFSVVKLSKKIYILTK